MLKKSVKIICALLAVSLAFSACSAIPGKVEGSKSGTAVKAFANISDSAWSYNPDDDVYYQTGLTYCENPVDTEYETLGIFVPGAYFDATENGDGTYTCTVNMENEVGGYTSQSAPIVMPVNTPGYAAMKAPSAYESACAAFTSHGFVYVAAGCRGREQGAPAGVTDLKAAIRYIRANSSITAGNTDSIFPFGMSGGGAQSALLGTTGDSELYTPYLEAIGAVSGVSDSVAGVMCWCPVTNLDVADAAYEWNLGVSRSDISDDEQVLSSDLAREYADYINELGLTDKKGNALTLEYSSEGVYQSGTYYDYIKGVIEKSLSNFLTDTEFPYDNSYSSGIDVYGTYETPADYIAALNTYGEWVTYEEGSGKVTISSVADFVKAFKNATKGIGAFDALDKSQPENILFGIGDGNALHFDGMLEELVDEENENTFEEDMEKTDSIGNDVEKRVDMYNPMYFLCDYYDGNGSSKVAKYWRIRSGINQGDTSLCTEVNLALALGVAGKSVDFETVWGQGHTEAERTGSATENFIAWVNNCLK